MNKVFDFMAQDHDRLDDIFKNFRTVKNEDLKKAKPLFHDFKIGLQKHIVWEEEILFPIFEKKTGMYETGPTAVMRMEHRQIKDFLEKIHTALWFYREWRDRKEGKTAPHVVGLHLHPEGKHFQRFAPLWRLAHLCFAISVMTLVLTGMAVFFAEMPWAHYVVALFGSPKTAAIVHRAAATVMLGIFFIHLVYVVGARVLPHWRTFQWFGPNSLVPNWKDLNDIIAMFQWFFGLRPRPRFDRWTYWEKFDYWAVFWGMAIIGGSGFMLAFPNATASLLPGWMFNVATIVHGEEAVLAAVFLFTVHFFNNHFRPDKFPLDIVMFTGAVSLDEFRREHALEYERLKRSGELERHLVDAPSRPMTIGSAFLGFVLIVIGLTLLLAVMRGFWTRV